MDLILFYKILQNLLRDSKIAMYSKREVYRQNFVFAV